MARFERTAADIDATTSVAPWFNWACFLLALSPLFYFWSSFRKLFWFGDELCLLSEMSRMGLISWSSATFAENAVPVFKLAWGGLTILGGGSYMVLIVALWLTHACNVLLLSQILVRAGLGLGSTLLAIATFAVAPGLHESLGWTVQWSAVLVVTFFLVGIAAVQTRILAQRSIPATLVVLTVCSFGAAFSFSRGILACGILSLTIALAHRKSGLPRFAPLLAFAPAMLAAAQVMLSSTGNHQHLSSAWQTSSAQMIEFALNFFLMNPVFRWFSDAAPDSTSLLVCGGVKLLLLVLAGRIAVRHGGFTAILFASFLLFDLGNTALVTIGRYHTGATYAVSSRYQYEMLLLLVPSIALITSQLQHRLPLRVARYLLSLVVLVLYTFAMVRWTPIMDDWAESRGAQGRKFFFAKPRKRPAEWWGLPNILAREEAERVIKLYQLH